MREILTCGHPRIVLMKSAQAGGTTGFVVLITYNLISGKYIQGFMVATPTADSSVSWSKSKFSPLIDDNPKIKQWVTATDSATLKRVRKSYLHFVGSQLTTSIEHGLKRTSTALVSTPSDGYLADEVDRIPPRSLELLRMRLAHSKVKHEFFVSTPTIPNYGIHAEYLKSDQRQWHIRCQSCAEYTCLEQEFPSCLLELSDGRVIRSCKKCRKEIFPANGVWVPQVPSQSDIRGYHISQLCSAYVQPKEILQAFNDGTGKEEFYNSVLGLPFITHENKLEATDIYSKCGQEFMLTKHPGPTCAGIDVGKQLHITVAFRPNEKTLQIVYVARVSSFADASDICHRFNTRCVVADIEPEGRAVREWQASERFPIFLCDYISSILSGPRWNEEQRTLQINRTEALDAVHNCLTSPGRIILPRRCSEIDEFAKELTNAARMIEEDESGSRRFVWRKTAGPDHFFHSLAYCLLASQRTRVIDRDSAHVQMLKKLEQDRQQSYDPLFFGTNNGDPDSPFALK